MTRYDAAFFRYVSVGATRSARQLLPTLLQQLTVESVLDIGCAQGAWLAVWRELGVTDLTGVDGSYVDSDKLLISRESFVAHDLAVGLNLGRRFSLVQSLEVAEHLPEQSAATFISSLVRHSDLILFSAACRGQGGDNHVNEQDYDYWRALFAQHGYVAVDFLRPRLLGNRAIDPWYRYNTLIYASPARFATLPAEIRECRVPNHMPIPDLSPVQYRFRKRLTMLLPVSLASGIARLKERAVVLLRDFGSRRSA
jgi:SAM-dependent methyltransferase